MTIKLIRMSSGEDVVATVLEDETDSIKIKDPIVIVPTGNNQLGFAPWSPVLDREVESITISKRFIVFMSEPNEPCSENYKAMFFNLVTPPEKKLIL
jgi:hypothetical protein